MRNFIKKILLGEKGSTLPYTIILIGVATSTFVYLNRSNQNYFTTQKQLASGLVKAPQLAAIRNLLEQRLNCKGTVVNGVTIYPVWPSAQVPSNDCKSYTQTPKYTSIWSTESEVALLGAGNATTVTTASGPQSCSTDIFVQVSQAKNLAGATVINPNYPSTLGGHKIRAYFGSCTVSAADPDCHGGGKLKVEVVLKNAAGQDQTVTAGSTTSLVWTEITDGFTLNCPYP